MHALISTTMGLLLVLGMTTAVGEPAQAKPTKSQQALMEGAKAVAAADPQTRALQAQAQPRPDNGDGDQGDEHASDRAIERVCNHDNPSAQRSAICNGVSPN
jgi:hypothetical protein